MEAGRKEAHLKKRWMFMVGGAVALAGAAALVMQPGADAQKPASELPAEARAAAKPATATEAARITTDELKAAMAKKDVVIIDTRSADAYAAGHIEGALNLPLQGLEARLNELPKNKLIAAYCT
jgi:3-mercaptopyruvate sulfurtransferase SseA